MTSSIPRKRILIFTTAYLPHVGGAEVAISEITRRLIPEYEFDLICARYETHLASRERVGEVQVYRVGIGIRIIDKLLLPIGGAFLALFLSRTRTYKNYWAMMVTYGSGGAYLANLLRFWRPVPVILTLQEGDSPHYLRTKWLGLVGLSWRLALAKSKTVTAISSYLAKLAIDFGYRGTPVVVPNGVATSTFSRTPRRRGAGEKITLITTSRLVHKNGIDTVIQALPLLNPSVVFNIYGTGPDEAKLRALARSLHVEDRVSFQGHRDHAELPQLLADADIFIRPSRSEGMGNSFIEAMAAKLPVIATQEGGIADFLFDAKRNPERATTGWAVDVDAPEQIARAVEDIRAHPDMVETVTETAYRLACEKYDWDLIAKKMRTIFD